MSPDFKHIIIGIMSNNQICLKDLVVLFWYSHNVFLNPEVANHPRRSSIFVQSFLGCPSYQLYHETLHRIQGRVRLLDTETKILLNWRYNLENSTCESWFQGSAFIGWMFRLIGTWWWLLWRTSASFFR